MFGEMPSISQLVSYVLEPGNLFYTIGNLLCVFGFAVRSMFKLRVLYVLGGFATLPYFLIARSSTQTFDPRWIGVFWVSVYIIINLKGIIQLYLEKRPILMSEEQKWLHEYVFRTITPREMIQLVDLGEWETAEPGSCIVKKGEMIDSLFLIHEGYADVLVDGELVATLSPGQFIGEMSFVRNGDRAAADVVFNQPTRYLRWTFDVLKEMENKNGKLHHILYTILSVDLARKLAGRPKQTVVALTDIWNRAAPDMPDQ